MATPTIARKYKGNASSNSVTINSVEVQAGESYTVDVVAQGSTTDVTSIVRSTDSTAQIVQVQANSRDTEAYSCQSPVVGTHNLTVNLDNSGQTHVYVTVWDDADTTDAIGGSNYNNASSSDSPNVTVTLQAADSATCQTVFFNSTSVTVSSVGDGQTLNDSIVVSFSSYNYYNDDPATSGDTTQNLTLSNSKDWNMIGYEILEAASYSGPDWYIDPDVTGGTGDGSSWANAFDSWADLGSLYSAGDTIHFRNTETLTTGPTMSVDGAANNPVQVIGYNSSGVDDGTLAVLDGDNSATNCLVLNASFIQFKNIHWTDATSNNVTFGAGELYNVFYNCYSDEAGGDGFYVNSCDHHTWIRCRSNNNNWNGWRQPDYGTFIHCEGIGNGTDGMQSTLRENICIDCNFSDNAQNGIGPNGDRPVIYGCVCDDNVNNIRMTASTDVGVVLHTTMTNGTDGLDVGGASSGFVENWNLYYNNTNDRVATGDIWEIGDSVDTVTDPYTNQTAGNYARAGTDLVNEEIEIDATNSSYIDTGLQKEATGGGSAVFSIFGEDIIR